MTDPQARKMPEEGEGEPESARSGLPSQDKSKNFPYLTQDSMQTSWAASVTSPTLPLQTFACRSDLEPGWQTGEGPSALLREDHLANDKADKIWWQIRDYSLESDDFSSSPEQRESPWAPENSLAGSRSFVENLYRSDDTEWYAEQDWYQVPPGPSGYVLQEEPESVKPDDELLMAGPELPAEDDDFDFENQASGGIMPRQEVSSAEPQASKDNLDSWAPLYRYLGVKTEYDYKDTYEYFQPLEPIMESPLEEENLDDTNEEAVGGALK